MKTMRVLLAAISTLLALGVQAQAWPSKPVKIIVAFPPGQATDTLARLMAEKLGNALGQPFIIDNRPGAGGVVGTEVAKNAAPDGYTLVMAPISSFAINVALQPNLPYDPLRDFAPISNIGLTPQTIMANPKAGIGSIKELVAKAKARPGELFYASSGNGSASHLAMESLQLAAGIKLTHVPFKGNADAFTQVIGGQIPLISDAVPGAAPQVRGGKLVALGVASLQRSPYLPDVPTVAEQGYPGFEVVGWIGIAAPARVPEPILDRLNAEIRKALEQPDVKEKLTAASFVTAGGTRAEFTDFIRAEIARWKKVVKDANVKTD
jgi:tripartite-type tricarboxylate transporter receptor subunit TctC